MTGYEAKNTSFRPPVRRLFAFIFFILIACFGGIGIWASLAPLDSAAVAPARVTVAGNRKSVQHLEGGIIEQLLVQEGDKVSAGQLLLRLDDTQAQATLAQLRVRYENLAARQARLLAERDHANDIKTELVPDLLRDDIDPERAAQAIAGEQSIFDARRTYMEGQKLILSQRVQQLHKQIEGFDAQLKAVTKQLALVREEEKAIKALFTKGMIDKPRLLATQANAAGLQGSQGKYLALIAEARQEIGETKSELIDLDNRMLSQVVAELKETQAELTELLQRLKAAKDVVARTLVLAPVSGTVVALDVHTERGVVAPGQRLLDIVPDQDRLELEAQVNPNDIDVVQLGLNAQVMLTAYKQRTTPTLQGKVSRLSADSFSDPRTGQSYYIVRVTVEPEQLEQWEEIELYPGMPADVMISTGRQTLLDYFLAPFTQSITRAFRES